MSSNKLSTSDIAMLGAFLSLEYDLPASDLDFLSENMTKRSYKKGDFILNEDEVERKNSFVISGIVHQYHMIENAKITINISLAGHAFHSRISYVEGSPSKQVQEALTDCTIIYIRKKDLERLMQKSNAFCFLLFKKYELFYLYRELRAFILQHKSPDQRFELFVTKDPRADRYLMEVPQKWVASYLGMRAETYSKVKSRYYKKS